MGGRIRTIVGATSVAAVVLAMSAATAVASPAGSLSRQLPSSPATLCPAGDFCVWTGVDFTGTEYKFTKSSANWPSSVHNKDVSIYDASSNYVRLYYAINYGDPHTCVIPGEAFPSLPFYFNSGTGANYRYPVQDDVASSSMDSNPCTNPMSGE
jgi:hypothetical protein